MVRRAALQNDVDGVICGHIHKAEIRQVGSILYANSGDWVESCTLLVEHHDGALELVDFERGPARSAYTAPGGDGEFGSTLGLSWICHLQE